MTSQSGPGVEMWCERVVEVTRSPELSGNLRHTLGRYPQATLRMRASQARTGTAYGHVRTSVTSTDELPCTTVKVDDLGDGEFSIRDVRAWSLQDGPLPHRDYRIRGEAPHGDATEWHRTFIKAAAGKWLRPRRPLAGLIPACTPGGANRTRRSVSISCQQKMNRQEHTMKQLPTI